jgi:hypothetical protein
MKYVVITAKHHDGFSMYDSKLTDFDIVDATPFKKDPMRELADAVRAEGMTFCFYYSVPDWHNPDFPAKYSQRATIDARRKYHRAGVSRSAKGRRGSGEICRVRKGPGPRAAHQLRADRHPVVRRRRRVREGHGPREQGTASEGDALAGDHRHDPRVAAQTAS